jgi:hypothetical protein
VKRTVPRLITSLVGILLILTTFVARPEGADAPWTVRAFDYVDRNFSVWFNLLAVFAFIVGGANLLKSHGSRILRRRADWGYSLVTLVSFVVVLVIGLFKIGGPPGVQGEVTDPGSWFTAVFSAVYDPLLATIFSLLAFFVASAAYRAFRLRSPEAAVLLISAFIVLLGRTPLGNWASNLLPVWLSALRVDTLAVWIMSVPNVAGQRAVLIGVSLGVAAMTVRILLWRGRADGGE